MDTCIFCTISENNIPRHEIVWEDEDHIAFLDINPCREGHTLVIPRAHSSDVLDMGEMQFAKLFEAARRLAILLKERLACERVSIVTEGGSIPHSHIHLIPLRAGQKLATFINESKSPDELAEIAKKVRGPGAVFLAKTFNLKSF